MEYIKTLNEMRKKVKEELNHIPRRDFDQNMLRQMYWGMRLQSLGKRADRETSKEEVLVKALRLAKQDNPAFCPKYDDQFFDTTKISEAAKDDPSILACFLKKKD
jgi:hypothetical protein